MSDTPRTDAEFEHVNNLHNEWVCSPQNAAIDFVEADFARQLERELQDAQARVRLLIAERDSARAIASTIASRSIDRAINTMQAIKRDSPERYAELLEALK